VRIATGVAGTSRLEQSFSQEAGRPNGGHKSSKLMGGAATQEWQFSQSVVSRQFQDSAKWRGDRNN
jgi:hypothetical protein